MEDFQYMPPIWYLSRICEEFNCDPETAKSLDDQEVRDILEYRSIFRAASADMESRTPDQDEVFNYWQKVFQKEEGFLLVKSKVSKVKETTYTAPRNLNDFPVTKENAS